MKVIRLTTLLDFGGQERQYLSLTEDKSLLTHKYIFAAIGFGGNAESQLRKRGFKVHILNANHSIRSVKTIWLLYKLFKIEKPDVVHTAAAEANFHGIIAAKMANIPIIIGEEIGLPNHSMLAEFVFKLVYKFANKVICVSQSVKEFLIDNGEINSDKGVVIYNPVSKPKSYHKQPSPYFNMVYVGRLEKVKNVELLICAMDVLSKDLKNIRLTIVGNGSEMEYLKLLTTQLKLDDIIEFVGYSQEPEKYVSQSDLFVLPSITEGFGIAAAEAMFQGVPCLSSNVGGMPEFITENYSGWLFNPNDMNELVSKIRSIYHLNNDNLIQIGKNAKTEVKSRFSNNIYIKKVEALYNELWLPNIE